MIAIISAGIVLVVGFACGLSFAMRRRFMAHLDRLEAKTREPDSAEGQRSDLPPEVLALAKRMVARADCATGFAVFAQSGQMWFTPGGKPVSFTARQTVRVTDTGFLWRAAMGAPGWTVVADYLVDGMGGLEAMLLGAYPLARMVGGAGAYQGEALRYLAELPWNPDAIIRNRSLDWSVLNEKTIKVATGVGAERGEVTFELDNDGLFFERVRLRAYMPKRRWYHVSPMAWTILGLSADRRATNAATGRGRMGPGRR
jgi:hypothetical protein